MYIISPGGGNGNPLRCCSLETSMDRGVWQAVVHGVAESDTAEWVSEHTRLFIFWLEFCGFWLSLSSPPHPNCDLFFCEFVFEVESTYSSSTRLVPGTWQWLAISQHYRMITMISPVPLHHHYITIQRSYIITDCIPHTVHFVPVTFIVVAGSLYLLISLPCFFPFHAPLTTTCLLLVSVSLSALIICLFRLLDPT